MDSHGSGHPPKTLWISLTRKGSVAYANSLLAQMPPNSIDAWLSKEAHQDLQLRPGKWSGVVRQMHTFSDKGSFIVNSFFRIPALLFRLIEMKMKGQLVRIIFPVYHIWNIPLICFAMLLRIRVWAIIHDAKLHPGDSAPGYDLYLSLVSRRASRICFLSDYVRNAMHLNEITKSIVSLHPPFEMAERRQEISNFGPLRLVFVGRILEYKGLDFLFELLVKLPADTWESCIIAGQGKILAIPSEIKSKIIVLNHWLPEDEMYRILRVQDLMLLPYAEASQSGVAAMAQGLGLPVIASDIGGLPQQLVGHGGITLKRHLPTWEKAIAEIYLDRNLLNKMEEEGAVLRAKQTWKKHAQDFFPELF
ncbi:MAG: glycosyltransferase [Saprospiraceae bacterium]